VAIENAFFWRLLVNRFFPAFAVFLLWKLGFSNSIFYVPKKSGLSPYVISMFFYWWMYYLSRNFQDQPIVLKSFFMGIFLATVFGLILNNYLKISLHGMGVGGGATAIVLIAIYYGASMGGLISVAILLAGLVCTARFLVSDHTNLEIYSGLIVGIACQLFAYWFVF